MDRHTRKVNLENFKVSLNKFTMGASIWADLRWVDPETERLMTNDNDLRWMEINRWLEWAKLHDNKLFEKANDLLQAAMRTIKTNG